MTVGNQEMKCDRQPNFKQYSKLSHRAEIPSIRRAVVSFSLSKVNSVTGNYDTCMLLTGKEQLISPCPKNLSLFEVDMQPRKEFAAVCRV